MRRIADSELTALVDGQRIRIAFHFYKRCFSIREAKNRRVIGYMDRIVVRDVTFVVLQSGRERALREKAKNVHAFVEGVYERELQAALSIKQMSHEAFYNPFFTSSFMDRETFTPVTKADIALCEQGKVYYQLINTNLNS